MPKQANGTPVYTRQHSRGPTLPQMSAIDLLAAGKTDQETAESLGRHRTTVSKWRLYDPVFQAALNRRRAEVWGSAADRLRALIPKALDTLASELESAGPYRVKAAVELLRLASAAAAPPSGPTDPDEIVRAVVRKRRQAAPDPLADLLDNGKNLLPFDQHVDQVWQELEARLAEPDTHAADGMQP